MQKSIIIYPIFSFSSFLPYLLPYLRRHIQRNIETSQHRRFARARLRKFNSLLYVHTRGNRGKPRGRREGRQGRAAKINSPNAACKRGRLQRGGLCMCCNYCTSKRATISIGPRPETLSLAVCLPPSSIL